MANIVNLDAYFEEVELLKQQINKQVSRITDNIQQFNCDPDVKTFLRRATYNCLLHSEGDMQELRDLIHNEKVDLQNLKIGTKIDPQQFLNHTECSLFDDINEKEDMLLIIYAPDAIPLSQLAIFYNDKHIITKFSVKL